MNIKKVGMASLDTRADIELVNFSIGLPKNMHFSKDQIVNTGICKQSVEEAYLTKDGFRGDGVADLKHHGGMIELSVFTLLNIMLNGKRKLENLWTQRLLGKI